MSKCVFATAIAVSAAAASGQATLYFSDFEANDGGLSPTGDWEWGTPIGADGTALGGFGGPEPIGGFSGDNAWGTVIGGLHNPGLTSDLKLGGFNMADAQSLSFWEYSESGSNAFDMAEVIVDGTQVYLSDGNSGLGWRQVTIDLSGFNSGDVTFRFTTTTVVERVGWYIDDVHVSGVPAPASAALLGLGGLAAARRRR